MKIERDNFYTTRDGQRAKCLTTELPGAHGGLMLLDDGDYFGVSRTGRYAHGKSDHSFDIIGPWVEPVKPMELWVNVYPEQPEFIYAHSSYEIAVRNVGPGANRVAVHMREVVGGEE